MSPCVLHAVRVLRCVLCGKPWLIPFWGLQCGEQQLSKGLVSAGNLHFQPTVRRLSVVLAAGSLLRFSHGCL